MNLILQYLKLPGIQSIAILSNCDCCALYKGGIYNDDTCCGALKKWAESEYIEKLLISKKDKVFLEYLKEEYKYMARDEEGYLFAYIDKPVKSSVLCGWSSRKANCVSVNRYFDTGFPMVKMSDDEPWLIEDLKKLEVVEEYEENSKKNSK